MSISRKYDSVEKYSQDLANNVVKVMKQKKGLVHEGLKKALEETTEKNVYSYPPLFEHRRKKEHGIADINEWENDTEKVSNVYIKTQLVSNAQWQHLYGGERPLTNLAEVIEKNKVYGAKPRPFTEKGETIFANDGDERIARELHKIGF